MFFSTLTGQLPGAKIMILLFSNLHVHGEFMELASTCIISIDTVVQFLHGISLEVYGTCEYY